MSELEDMVGEIMGAALAMPKPIERKNSLGEILIQARVVRPIVPRDLLRMQETEINMGCNVKPLKQLRTRHHKLAQMKATGKFTNQEIAVATGYGVGRVDTLLADPSMMELVAFYQRAEIEGMIEAKAEVKVKFENIVDTGTDILQERLEDSPEEFTSMQILDVVERLADRCGFGPKTQVDARVAVGLFVEDATLEAIKARAEHEARGRVIQGQSTPSSGERTEASGDGERCEVLQNQPETQLPSNPASGFDLPEESAQEGGTGFREMGKKA